MNSTTLLDSPIDRTGHVLNVIRNHGWDWQYCWSEHLLEDSLLG